MDEIAALLDRMRDLEPEVHIQGPASEADIRQLETAFGRPMPPSYRAFLARFGAFSIVENPYSGIITGKYADCKGSVWADTTYARKWCHIPEHYLVVEPDADGYTCLDFCRKSDDGEHPVIYHMPFRETPFDECAPNYFAWLRESLECMIEAWLDADPLIPEPPHEHPR